jgi:hypothetical protein
MPVFPQLSTGASALYPVARRTVARTVVNEMSDGSAIVYSDPDGRRREWELRASGLTEEEWAAIEALFTAVRGQLQTFTFLDPAGNLLARSEEFGDPVWTNGPLIQLTPGVGDPFGTTRATGVVNVGAAAQGVTQTLAAPGEFRYSLSVWARSGAGGGVTLFAGGASLVVAALTPVWRRYSLSVAPGAAAASVTFGVQVPAAGSLDLFGMQVEAQVGVSDYKRTFGSGGVYQARLGGDELAVRARGADEFEVAVRIVAVGT